MKKVLLVAALVLIPGSAFATQAFICAKHPTEEMDHPQATVSMIGQDTAGAEVDADFSFFLRGKPYMGEATARRTKNGFTVKTVDSKGCVVDFEFSRYRLAPPDLLCNDCGKKERAPMVRVWKKCGQAWRTVAYELPCMHYED